jgi:exosortase/archaeosortase family protein
LAALIGLSMLLLAGPWYRRLVAGTIAATVVFCGNLFRIAVVLYVGHIRGVSALVLFHDWIGTAFSITYTLLGFLILIAARMPGRRRWTNEQPLTYGL